MTPEEAAREDMHTAEAQLRARRVAREAAAKKIHVYREGNNFTFRPGVTSWHVGYFEYGNYDGEPQVYWKWSQFAQQDRHAQTWVTRELRMREELLQRPQETTA